MFNLRPSPLPNPCGQCGKPIATPAWTEVDGNRAHFVWQCGACNYRFQSTAVYQAEEQIAA
jgi:ribosomal protein L37AE/L43A